MRGAALTRETSEAGGVPCPAGVWVVVPAFEEAGRIGAVLDALLALGVDVVVVDDGSADGTSAEALRRRAWVVRHAVNLGQGAALQTGIRFALSRAARFVVTFDADGQHGPEDVVRLVAPLADGRADFTLGSRFLGEAVGIPASRRFLLRLAVLFTWLFSGVRTTDVHNGLRGMTRRGAEAIHLTLNRMEHASQILEQIVASGLPFVEVPVTVRYTPDSLAKGQRSRDAFRLATKLLLERFLP